MAEFTGFHELSEDLSVLAEHFREEYRRSMNDPETGEFTSTKEAIESGINSAMEDIVRMSRQRARKHVGERAESIDHESMGWVGKNDYLHKFYSESDIVAFHEFGTGTEAEHPRYPGTVNAVNASGNRGYLIEPTGDNPLAFDIGGHTVVVEYVVHPGVEAQHFMEQTLRRNTSHIKDEVINALENRFEKDLT